MASRTRRRSLGTCSVDGCPELTRERYCERHQAEADRASDARRPSARERGYDAQHERERRRYLAAHPTCEHPGCTDPSEVLDHIDGLGPNGPRGHDPANWQALCGPHHRAKTNLEDGGGWPGPGEG